MTTNATPARSGIGRATVVMAGGTILSRLTGLLRTVAFAGLGATLLSDAYTLANNSPNIIFELVVGGVLSATLIPVFVDLLGRGRDEAEEGISAIVTLALTVSVALALALALFAPWVIRLYNVFDSSPDPNQQALATALLRLFAPQVAIYGFITVATALLNARRRFAAPMFAPILNNIVVIVVMIWAQHLLHQLARVSSIDLKRNPSASLNLVRLDTPTTLLLGLGTTAGVVAMGAALLPSLRRSGIRFRFRWDPRHPAVATVLRLAGWTFGYVIANQVALNFVYAVAKRRDGDLSVYTLAFSTFFLLPHGVVAVSIMTAMQPQLSLDFIERRRGRFRMRLNEGIRNILCLLVPAAAFYVAVARPIVEFALMRGQMTLEKSNLIADTTRAFAVGLPAFSCYLLLMNALKAMRNTRATFELNVVENAVNIVLAALLYSHWGVQGLAAAFAIAYIVASVAAGRVVGRHIGGIGGFAIATSLRNILATSTAMGFGAWLASWSIDHVVGRHALLFRLPNRLALLAEISAAAMVGVTVYLSVGRMIGVSELRAVLAPVRRRLSKRAGHPQPATRRPPTMPTINQRPDRRS